MVEKKMIKIRYINENDGFTNGIPGKMEKERIIEVSEELAMSLVRDGKSNFFELVEEEQQKEKPKKKIK